jgi:hypothetical protein
MNSDGNQPRRSRVKATLRLHFAVFALALLGASIPAAAQAVEVGIADSEPSTFDSPLLTSGSPDIERFRIIVPWNVATRKPGDPHYDRRVEFEEWISKFLVFRQTHPSASFNVGLERINTGESDLPGYGHAPTGAEYKAGFYEFLNAYWEYIPFMRIDPWNEPNYDPGNGSRLLLPGGTAYLDDPDGGSCNSSDPQAETCGPRMAAYYYRWALDQCNLYLLECNLEAGEFAGHTGYDYIQKYKRHLGTVRPTVWGVHNYSDVATYQNKGTVESSKYELLSMIRELYCINETNRGVALGPHHCTSTTNWSGTKPPIWVTATGAGYTFACQRHRTMPGCALPSTKVYVTDTELARTQCQAMAWMMRWPTEVDSRITRIYPYTFMDKNFQNSEDDTGVVNKEGTVARPAYNVLRNALTTC